ncbi:amidohydrolase/deacetylase family metallohydrolase [Dyadobacter chenwenxiniae]|uniref:Amidohydrolase/deacetylase family metallohydrolase n=1 Tax=Dyadobacter chenwenxiniae TaxID=2906456 RepID=A0A9X1PMU8_9BACT|nr:amidohydrolase/deacetylase family metallohydrolase [Dyadobacter chenwenxiniae]MCF0064282.1 amidohydrolase/deacetylase family metallohydrolase [Dyadobacter chenwenxiniae]UON82506.1 amidohydrolase/deacetylase family metallohydrolase [Dyadobacter chenwenxiniae]
MFLKNIYTLVNACKIHFCLSALLILSSSVFSQKYDLLIKGGHVIDPANGIDKVMDVAVSKGIIAKVAVKIDEAAEKIIQAKGLYVTPGFIDMHTHVFVGPNAGTFANGVNSVSPDDFTFRSGVTTVVDAGTSGWRSFPLFKKQVIDQSKTRILAFVNIAGDGMTGDGHEQNIEDMVPDSALRIINRYSETIVGVKIGHYNGTDWTPFDNAIKLARQVEKPLFVECHLPQYSFQDQLEKLSPGDMITHTFENIKERMPIIGDDGKVRPFVLEAKKRGVLFDLGHGGAGFWFDQAAPAVKQGFAPNSFGTDLHRFSMNSAMKDMTNVMSKFMALGLSLHDVVQIATWNAAKAINHESLGNIKAGNVADLAIFKIRDGTFGFTDSGGKTISGSRKLEVEMTVREGKIVWDLNGLGARKTDF